MVVIRYALYPYLSELMYFQGHYSGIVNLRTAWMCALYYIMFILYETVILLMLSCYCWFFLGNLVTKSGDMWGRAIELNIIIRYALFVSLKFGL